MINSYQFKLNHCFEINFQPKKWPNYQLKSPGIKPKQENKLKSGGAFHFGNKNRRCSKSHVNINASEDDESPIVFDFHITSTPVFPKTEKRCEKRKETKYEGQELITLRMSQVRQALDAPTLLPRNVSSAPPVPTRDLKHFAMRMSNIANMNIEQSLYRLCLQLPNTSTIMMRRNLATKPRSTTKDEDEASTSTGSIERPKE